MVASHAGSEAAAGESGRRQQPAARGRRATNATLVIIQQPGEGSSQQPWLQQASPRSTQPSSSQGKKANECQTT
jgi:hypothetical protein